MTTAQHATRTWVSQGQSPIPAGNIRSVSMHTASHAVGTDVTIATLTGSGTVRSIWITTAIPIGDALLQVFVDGEATPSFSVDLWTLFMWKRFVPDGSLASDRIVTQMSGGGYSGTGLFKFPIPYSDGCVIKISNPQYGPTTHWTQVTYETNTPAPYRLHSFGVPDLTPLNVAIGASPVLVDRVQAAKDSSLVWLSLHIENASADTNLERDVNIYVDGESVPSLASTGTEDFMQSGYYWHGLAQVATPASIVSSNANANHYFNGGIDLWTAYGGVKFTTELKIVWATGGMDQTCDIAYCGLFYVAI